MLGAEVEGLEASDKVLFTSLNREGLVEGSEQTNGGVSETIEGRAIATFFIRLRVFSVEDEGVGGTTTGGAGLGNGAFFNFILTVPVAATFSTTTGALVTVASTLSEVLGDTGVVSDVLVTVLDITKGVSDGAVDVRGIKGRTGAFWPNATSAETRADAGGVAGTTFFAGWKEISFPVLGSMIASRRLAGLATGAD